MHSPRRIVGCERMYLVIHLPALGVVDSADGIVVLVERVHVVADLFQALSLCPAGEAAVVYTEVAVEVEHDGLSPECLTTIGYRSAPRQLLRPHVFEPFARIEVEQQVFLFRRRLQHAGVGQDDGGVFEAVGHPVYHDAIEHARLQVLMLYIEVGFGNAVVEHPFGYLQFRAFLFHGREQFGHLVVGCRSYVVLEIERPYGYEEDDHR